MRAKGKTTALVILVCAVFVIHPGYAQTAAGDYASHTVSANQVNFTLSSNATVRVEFCKTDVARIRLALPGAQFIADEPYIVIKYNWPSVASMVTDQGTYIKIATADMVIRANKSPFKLDFYNAANTAAIVTQSNGDPMSWNRNVKTMSFDLDAAGVQEHFFGCGMHFNYVDLRGRNMVNYQRSELASDTSGAYLVSNPYYWSTAGYGMLLHNSYTSLFDFGKANASRITWQVTNGELDFYFLKGPSLKKIMQSYCDLTGYREMPPKKALGLTYRGWGNWDGCCGGEKGAWSADEYDRLTDTFRLKGVPCDIIGLEPGWNTTYSGMVWNQTRFPDPKAWCQRMTAKGFEPNLWMQGVIVDKQISTAYYGQGDFLDITNPQVTDAYFNWLKTNFFDLGISGLKQDWHEGPNANWTLASGDSIRPYHNSFWFIWSDQIANRYRATCNKRFLMYNSGLYTGGQRITMVTYSDIGVRIPEVVNSGFTGMAYAPELMGWSAPGEELHAIAFSPFMVDNEWIFCCHLPWRTSASSFATYLKYVKLHYRLIPYIYSHFWEQHTTGVGPIRPLQIEFQDDPQTYSISNQYFYGRNLMVSFDHSTIYLPQGKWIYYWNGRVYEGKQTLQNFGAPSDELPVFVRGGAIIPMMPDMNYVGEKPIDPLIVDVYPQGSSEFTLFEDDGISFNYEKGDYCETRYENTGGKAIIINARNSPGQYSPPARSYLFKVHYGSDPKSIYLNSTALSKKASEAKLLTSKNGWYYSNGLVEVVFADNGALMRLGLGKPVPSAASSDFENK